MNEKNSLAIFSKAALMLAEADTIQKAKELKSLSLTAAEWAKRKGLGDEAVQYARSYALEAERKMGEMLLATERATGNQHTKSAKSPDVTKQPTLASLGITKRESSEAQTLANLPQEVFERVKKGESTKAEIKRIAKSKKDRERKAAQLKCEAPDGVRRGDFRKVLDDVKNINAIITDPPYGKDAIPLWRDLGKFAAARLADDGVLVAYSGQMYLPEVLSVLGESLDYFWTMAVFHEGNGNLTPLGHPVRKVINCWKPIVFFCKKGCGFPKTFRDVVKAHRPDKAGHNWAQPVGEAEWLIEQFTEPGETVVDPFSGSGTVAKACSNTSRKFIGAEVLA